MGKRKRACVSPPPASSDDDALPAASLPDHALPAQPISPPAPDTMPCSSGMELSLKENSSHSVDSSDTKPPSLVTDIADNKVLNQNDHSSIGHHHSGVGRSIFLKRSRHSFGHQYSRRNSFHHANASTSNGRFIPIRHEKLSFKLASQCKSESGQQADNRETPDFRTERIRASSLVTGEMVKKVCGICQKLLKKKPFNLGSTLSLSELSVIAILVCGHLYHADCLEQRTCLEDRRDPTCPICTDLTSRDGHK